MDPSPDTVPDAEDAGAAANAENARWLVSETRGAARHLWLFFMLAFGIAWSCFIPVAAGRIAVQSLPGRLVVLVGTFAPSLAALGITAATSRLVGVRALLAELSPAGIAWQWYAFAALYMAGIKLVAALLDRLVTGAWPHFGTEPLGLLAVATLFSTPFQAGEEIGWRGYALPRLAARRGYGTAGLLLGVIWAWWHLPLFFVSTADKYGQSFSVYVLQVTALSVALTWLYIRVRGRLLPLMLMHAAINNTKDIVPSTTPGAANTFSFDASRVAWLTVALLWVCAAYFLARMHGRRA